MGKRRQQWAIGDFFLVELANGDRVVGQIVGREPQALNSVTCAFFDVRVEGGSDEVKIPEIRPQDAFSVLFCTRDLLDAGRWAVVGRGPVAIDPRHLPYEDLRESGFVGARIIGSGNVNEFLNAFYGLAPWDDWKDPAYLDGLLLSPDKKPADLVFKKSGPRR